MADDVRRSSANAPAVATASQTALTVAAPSRAERARRTAYRGRFALLFVLLAATAGAAIGTAVVLVGRDAPPPAPPWSDWEPVGSPERRVAQIADHITDPYRLPSGKQLATATYSGLPTVTVQGAVSPVGAIAVQADASGGAAEADDIDAYDARKTVMFTLCGLGQRCSIAEGAATPERAALLRREALELGLFTFKYVDSVDTVVVLLPPRPDGQVATTVFLERGDVRSELARPLAETLTAPLTPGVGEIANDELRAIDRITRSRLYQYGYLQAQDGSFVMVLEPALSS
jgi:hypothetical protein